MKRFLASLLAVCMVLSLGTFTAFAAGDDVVITVTPSITAKETTEAVDVIYTVTVAPQNGVKVGAFSFVFDVPENMTLATNQVAAANGNGYWVDPMMAFHPMFNLNGTFETFAYVAAEKKFNAAGTTAERNLSSETVIMTIKATIAAGKAGSYELDLTNVIAGDHTGEAEGRYENVSVVTTPVVITVPHTHVYDQQNTAEKYQVSPATCTAKAVYKYSCECGEAGSETFVYGNVADHDWTEQNTDASYKVDGSGANCQDKVEYYYGCKTCEAISDSLTWESDVAGAHVFTEQKEDAAHLVAGTGVNCQSKKQYYYDCALCDAIGTTTWTSESVGDHVLSDYVQENDKHYKTCTVSGCDHSTTPEACTGGDPATCQTKSVCSTCGNAYGEFAAHNLTTGYVPFGAEGHAHKCQTPNCTYNDGIVAHTGMEGDKICDVCGYDANCKHEGTKTTHAAVASTCKTPGHAQYVTCDNCSAVIEGSDAPLALDPDNHTGEGTKLGTNKADPTCSTPGNTGDTLCAGCDYVLQPGTPIPAQHTLTKVPGTAADCKNTGLVDTWVCSGECGKTYIDEAATVEADATNVIAPVDPTAHNWVDGVCTIEPKHVQMEKQPGTKVEQEIAGLPATTPTVKVVTETGLEDVEDVTKIFKEGKITVEAGKISFELERTAPVGEYYIQIDDYVVSVVVAKDEDEPERGDRPTRPSATSDAVKDVIDMIDELPSAKKVTLDDEEDIEDARKAYEKLSKADKVKVTNYEALVEAEEALEALKTADPEVIDNPFVDVDEDAYYADPVLWAVANNITSGTSAVTFSPDAVCTRAQVVTFLWRAAGCPAPLTTEMPFVDVEAGAYYAAAVQWAVENNITAGTSATTFDPNGKCTRGQIVTFLWRAQGNPAAAAVNNFVDVEDGAYYNAPVLWAVANGITNGTSTTTFSPAADCTRAQVVTFIYRCMAE